MRKICASLIVGILVIGSLTGCACGRASQIVGTWNEVQDYSQVNSEPARKVCGIWIEDIPESQNRDVLYLRGDKYNAQIYGGYDGGSWIIDENDPDIIIYNKYPIAVEGVPLSDMTRYKYHPENDTITNIVDDSFDEVRYVRMNPVKMVLNSDNRGTYGDREAKWEFDESHNSLKVKVKRPDTNKDYDGQEWLVYDICHFYYDKDKQRLCRSYMDGSMFDMSRYMEKEVPAK